MKNFLLKKFNNFKNDYVLKYGFLVAIVMLSCQIWMFIDSGFLIQPLVRIIFYSTIIFVSFFAGREGMFFEFVIFAYTISLNITFFNFTPFLMILCYMMIKAKSNKIRDNLKIWIPLIIPYIVCVCVACEMHYKSASHLVYHFLGCLIFFTIEWKFIRNKKYSKTLILDPDQERILNDLAHGKMQKEIEYFSKNTITDKLKNAIERNGCLTKEQLLMRYIASNPEFN